MTIAEQYARALHSLVEKNPTGSNGYVKNLEQALKRRGHQKLLPQVFASYQTLELAARRAAEHRRVSPSAERTRVLLELYRKLIANS